MACAMSNPLQRNLADDLNTAKTVQVDLRRQILNTQRAISNLQLHYENAKVESMCYAFGHTAVFSYQARIEAEYRLKNSLVKELGFVGKEVTELEEKLGLEGKKQRKMWFLVRVQRQKLWNIEERLIMMRIPFCGYHSSIQSNITPNWTFNRTILWPLNKYNILSMITLSCVIDFLSGNVDCLNLFSPKCWVNLVVNRSSSGCSETNLDSEIAP